ncbi:MULTISPECIES: hypothetical protein [Vibrio harveyi group]|uniref:hypothetical protein n=1 Tax=Vibrio harveyi group TaxID=717610 RepID=UPI0011ED2869|nr:hypothetical protein [Vibrio alginolyticus]TYZ37414.1 hypothetical protein EWT61_06860 [Vibrio alginolyticus]
MNKSIVFSAVIIGISIVASPFIYDVVKSAQRKEKQEKIAVQREIADVIGLEHAADLYKKAKGNCPHRVSDMVGVIIKREPKDRFGLEYETKGDCKFRSLEGITASSI